MALLNILSTSLLILFNFLLIMKGREGEGERGGTIGWEQSEDKFRESILSFHLVGATFLFLFLQ